MGHRDPSHPRGCRGVSGPRARSVAAPTSAACRSRCRSPRDRWSRAPGSGCVRPPRPGRRGRRSHSAAGWPMKIPSNWPRFSCPYVFRRPVNSRCGIGDPMSASARWSMRALQRATDVDAPVSSRMASAVPRATPSERLLRAMSRIRLLVDPLDHPAFRKEAQTVGDEHEARGGPTHGRCVERSGHGCYSDRYSRANGSPKWVHRSRAHPRRGHGHRDLRDCANSGIMGSVQRPCA